MIESGVENKDALLIDLNFVPVWARKPPSVAGGEGRHPESLPEQHDAAGRRRDNRGSSWSEDRGRTGGRPARRGPREPRRGSGGDGEGRAGAPTQAQAPDVRLDALDLAFLPERHGLAPLAHRLGRSCRAYSLFEIAALFLSKPEYHAIKIEARPGTEPPFELYQCTECKAVFLDKEAAAGHAFSRHFERFCKREETEVDPPKGNFVCVARCGLSGVLLGPPNYHSYNDRVAEIHRTRYAGMPMDAYRKRIEIVHDAALIEKWKDEMKRQVTYRFGETEQAVTFTRFADAEAWFRDHCMEAMLKSGRHFVMPGTAVPEMGESPLRRMIQDALQQESRFPLKLSIALRLAFRHLGLHTFKTGGGLTFLTAVVPTAIDPAHAVPVVRRILGFVTSKPGCLRQEMVADLCRPEAGAAPAEGSVPAEGTALPAVPAEPALTEAEVNAQLKWLVEKGHVIEFSDGRLAVPSEAVSRVQMAHPHGHGHRDQKEDRKQGGQRSS